MSLTLILMRHAKSSWSDKTIDDFDRSLNERGRRSARAIGTWLSEKGHVPDDVVVSGARRTVDTWAGIAPMLPRVADMRSSPALYPGTLETLLAVVRGARATPLLLIGHNPACANFAARIVTERGNHPRFDDFPTGATAVIEFSASAWEAVDWGEGRLAGFMVPRELLD
ncbi:MAG: histidine phosphatase family protein [Pseudomonadota bacterium]